MHMLALVALWNALFDVNVYFKIMHLKLPYILEILLTIYISPYVLFTKRYKFNFQTVFGNE